MNRKSRSEKLTAFVSVIIRSINFFLTVSENCSSTLKTTFSKDFVNLSYNSLSVRNVFKSFMSPRGYYATFFSEDYLCYFKADLITTSGSLYRLHHFVNGLPLVTHD